MPLKVFISNIDRELGRELVELFRNDHVNLSDPNIIVGTAAQASSAQTYRAIVFSQQPSLTIRAAMECDVVVLDLRQQSPENELIIKYLGQAQCRGIRIIGVSSFLTWGNTPSEALPSAESKEQALIESCRPFEPNEKSYSSRLPSWSAVYQHQLEESLIDLSVRRGFNVSIIVSGIQYGCAYEQFLSEFDASLRYGLPLSVQGSGSNTVPMIHVQDLAKMVQLLALPKGKPDQLFLFAVDSSQTTLQGLLAALASSLGVEKQAVKYNGVVGTLHSEELQLNIKTRVSPALNAIDWTCKEGIVSSRHKILQEFLTYRQFRFNQVELSVDESSISKCKQAFANLGYQILSRDILLSSLESIEKGERCQLVSAQSAQLIAEEISAQRKEFQQRNVQSEDKKKKVQKEPIAYAYSGNIIHQTIEAFFQQSRHRNRLLVQDPLYSKLIAAIDTPHHRRVSICSGDAPNDGNTDAILIDSPEYRMLLGQQEEEHPEPTPPQSPHVEAEICDPVQERDYDSPQIVNMKQYLIDNVMPKVTEAIVRIQQERPSNIMLSFIGMLREIEAKSLEGQASARKKKQGEAAG